MESFASDSYHYQREAVRLAGTLKEGGLRAWAAQREPPHVKLISLQFALLGPLFGYSTLSAEPLNLFCYVAILSLVLLLGREVGGRRVGLLAAGAVALWPTFLLHTTQLLKDPLFIAGSLALILITTTWLTRTYDWRGAVGVGALMSVTAGLLLLVRAQFGVVIFAVVFFALALLIVRQLLERRLLVWNLTCALLILLAGSLAALFQTTAYQKTKQYPSGGGGRQKSAAGPGRQFPGVISYKSPAAPKMTKPPPTFTGRLYALPERAAVEVNRARDRFNISYPESGSSIDRHVEYGNAKDLIDYLPRAFAVGFWAPFPETWLGAGRRVGSAGRLLSGAETFLIYVCQLLALLAIWRAPRRLPAWLLFLIITFGVTALGLVVSNVGALYRFRYLFWTLLIILGVKGLESIIGGLKTEGLNKRSAAGAAAACLLVAACSCGPRAGSASVDANQTPPSAAELSAGAAQARAPASALDFTLVNLTGTTLRAVHVSPLASEGWEENVLGRDELSDGEVVEISFSPEEPSVSWDLRVEDNDGNSAEWKGLDLREISRITLRIGKGTEEVTAEAE